MGFPSHRGGAATTRVEITLASLVQRYIEHQRVLLDHRYRPRALPAEDVVARAATLSKGGATLSTLVTRRRRAPAAPPIVRIPIREWLADEIPILRSRWRGWRAASVRRVRGRRGRHAR